MSSEGSRNCPVMRDTRSPPRFTRSEARHARRVTHSPGTERRQVDWPSDRSSPSGTTLSREIRNWRSEMVFRRFLVGFVALPAILIAVRARGQEAGKPSVYPDAPRSETFEDYHGTKVADPY